MSGRWRNFISIGDGLKDAYRRVLGHPAVDVFWVSTDYRRSRAHFGLGMRIVAVRRRAIRKRFGYAGR